MGSARNYQSKFGFHFWGCLQQHPEMLADAPSNLDLKAQGLGHLLRMVLDYINEAHHRRRPSRRLS